MSPRERRAIEAHNLHHPDHLRTWILGRSTSVRMGCPDCGWFAWFPR